MTGSDKSSRTMDVRRQFASSMRTALLILLFLGGALVFGAPAFAQETASGTENIEGLIEILKNDESREALITELERAISDPAVSSENVEPAPEISLGRRIALLTQEVAESAAGEISKAFSGLSAAGSTFGALGADELFAVGRVLVDLLLLIALTVIIFVVLRRSIVPIYERMGAKAGDAGLVQTIALFAGSVLIDALIVIVAWASGYAVSVFLLGEFGQIGIRQSLYLNAFLVVELVKVASRAVISPTTGGLRLLPIQDRGARRLSRYVNVVVSVLGYGQLLLVPVANQAASYSAGRGLSASISILVLLYLAFAVVRHRRAVADWMIAAFQSPAGTDVSGDENAEGSSSVRTRVPGAAILRGWHWFAMIYLLFIFSTVVAGSTTALIEAVTGSGKIALAVIIASLISRYLVSAMANGIRLPEEVNLKLPLLERRLNALVPKLLFLIRYLILGLVLLFALDVIGALSLRSWLESQIGRQLTSTIFSVATIAIVVTVIWLAVTSWVDYRLNPDYGSVPTARETTLLTLLRNAATIVLLAFGLMFCLSELGLDIGPLLASAGVLGLAIGFGAQKMVQDIITGIFIQFENAINVGDVITVGGITGGVEKLSVRSVSLRDAHGVFHIIPFSSVDMVSNFTREFSYFVCDMGISYREDVEEAKQAMFDAYEELQRDEDQAQFLMGDLEWFGLNAFGDSAVVLRARIKTSPGKQWGVGRAYNQILKTIFDERGIEIPFPHQTIYFGESKDGSTQTLKIATTSDGSPSD